METAETALRNRHAALDYNRFCFTNVQGKETSEYISQSYESTPLSVLSFQNHRKVVFVTPGFKVQLYFTTLGEFCDASRTGNVQESRRSNRLFPAVDVLSDLSHIQHLLLSFSIF